MDDNAERRSFFSYVSILYCEIEFSHKILYNRNKLFSTTNF